MNFIYNFIGQQALLEQKQYLIRQQAIQTNKNPEAPLSIWASLL